VVTVSRTLLLPSGKLATRFWSQGEFYWQLPTRGTEEWVTLGDADVRALLEFAIANRETGGSIPAAAAAEHPFPAGVTVVIGTEPPVLNKSGGESLSDVLWGRPTVHVSGELSSCGCGVIAAHCPACADHVARCRFQGEEVPGR